MNITAQHYLNLVGSETQTISKLLASAISDGKKLSMHCLALYFDSRAMLKSSLKIIKGSDQLLDEDMRFVDSLDRLEKETKEICNKMGPELFLFWFLLKKTANNYGLIISTIIQHNAQLLEIPDTELPIDEIMTALNQPVNKSMLEQSLSELKAGNIVQHGLLHE